MLLIWGPFRLVLPRAVCVGRCCSIGRQNFDDLRGEIWRKSAKVMACIYSRLKFLCTWHIWARGCPPGGLFERMMSKTGQREREINKQSAYFATEGDLACNVCTQNTISWSIYELQSWFLAHFEAGNKPCSINTTSHRSRWLKQVFGMIFLRTVCFGSWWCSQGRQNFDDLGYKSWQFWQPWRQHCENLWKSWCSSVWV